MNFPSPSSAPVIVPKELIALPPAEQLSVSQSHEAAVNAAELAARAAGGGDPSPQ